MRQATEKDLDKILDMGRAFCEALDESWQDESIAKTALNLIHGDSGVILIDDFGMAAALVYPHYFDESKLVCQELAWWIDPAARGNGSGVKLLGELESWARDKGATRLVMIAMDALQGEAVGILYKRKGFRRFEATWIKEL